jgi:hypothetical protein
VRPGKFLFNPQSIQRTRGIGTGICPQNMQITQKGKGEGGVLFWREVAQNSQKLGVGFLKAEE